MVSSGTAFEQTQAEDGLGDAHRGHGLRTQRAEAGIFDAQLGPAQSDLFAIGECHDALVPVEVEFRFRGNRLARAGSFQPSGLAARDSAVDRRSAPQRLRPAVPIDAWHADAYHHGSQLRAERVGEAFLVRKRGDRHCTDPPRTWDRAPESPALTANTDQG